MRDERGSDRAVVVAGRWRRLRRVPNALVTGAMRLVAAAAVVVAPRVALAQSKTEFEPLLGVRFGGAQHQSVYTGFAILTHKTPDDHSGPALEVEAGRSAGQVGLGYFATGPNAGQLRAQLVGLRTWRKATEIAPGQTFIGIETQASMFLGVSVGYYRRIHGTAPGDSRFKAIRFVVGF